MKVATHTFDAVIVGGGGAGLRSAIEMAQTGLNVAVMEITAARNVPSPLLAILSQMIGAGICMTPLWGQTF